MPHHIAMSPARRSRCQKHSSPAVSLNDQDDDTAPPDCHCRPSGSLAISGPSRCSSLSTAEWSARNGRRCLSFLEFGDDLPTLPPIVGAHAPLFGHEAGVRRAIGVPCHEAAVVTGDFDEPPGGIILEALPGAITAALDAGLVACRIIRVSCRRDAV